MASQLANTMWNSLKGRPVLGRIYQGKEPPQFVALFQPMVILKVYVKPTKHNRLRSFYVIVSNGCLV